MFQPRLLQPSFELYEIRASVLIAAIASYAALTLAGRVGARRGREHLAWVGWGGAALGLGISAIHFLGMLSMHLPVEVSYESRRTLLSVLFAIAASTLALDIAGDETLGFPRLAIGSLLFGGAVAGMHYIGISAIRAPVVIDLEPVRVAVSVAIAMATGAGALWLAFRLRDGTGATAGAQRIASAVILGAAIAGMHYTAMSAMQFHMTRDPRALATSLDGPLISGRGTSVLIATASFLVLVGAVVSALIDQNARQELRQTQLELERRVVEREAEAAKAIELYYLLAEHATDMVSTHHPDGRFAYASPSWSDFMGIGPGEIVGRLPADLAHPDDVPLLIEHHKRGLKSYGVLTTVWRCKRTNGDYAWLETTSRSVRHGAAARVKTFVCATRDVTQRKQMEQELARREEELRALALVDDLTGLANRRGFRMLAEQHLRLVKRGGPVSLLACFDLDDFKRVNDVHGHAEGDAALRRMASILRTAFRDSDIIARFGGDEFVVLALDCGEIREELLGRVEAAVDAHNEAAARPYSLSLSLGTALLDPFNPVSLDALMAEADANLYEAKRQRAVREMMA